jgi:hypothetical protein
MVICNTTICIDNSVAEEWSLWMKVTYIPLLLNTGSFIDVRLLKVLNNQDQGGTSFALMMMSRDMQTYTDFEAKHARKLDQLHSIKYGTKFVSFRTMLEESK